jgi:antitoxin CptB
MTEAPETRIKRLKMRSWRRGIQEMDLILGKFSDTELANLDAAGLDLYEQLLEENDWDLYYWVTGAQDTPEHYDALIERLAAFHKLG